jgi:hypothetical protein
MHPRIQAFLSYSSRDRHRAIEIADALETRGIGLWRDQKEILGGENYGPKIVEAIKRSSVLLLCCSRNSVGNKNVKQEVQIAWTSHVPCLPLLLDGVTDFAQLEYWLTGIQYVDVSSGAKNDWLPAIDNAIESLTIGRVAPAVAASVPSSGGLSELRALARFTDRIWPERYTPQPRAVTRDLGAVPGSAAYQFRRGDHIALRVDIEQSGHLLLLDQGTSGKIYCLCPSRFCPSSEVVAGLLSIPQPASPYPFLEVSGPAGHETLLAVIASTQPPFELMPQQATQLARQLEASESNRLLEWLRALPPDTWEAMATEFEILP